MEKSYQLTPEEQAAVQGLNVSAVNAKVKLNDLREQVTQAEKDLAGAIAQFNGGLSLLASVHGMEAVTLSADMRFLVAGATK